MSLQVKAVTNAVLDLAQEPRVGGDNIPISVTATNASPAVFTAAADYIPTLGDRVVLSATGSVPTGFTAGTTYYVVSPSGRTFELSATSGGSAINSSSTGSGITAHVSAKAAQGASVNLPFKPENSVVVFNPSAGSLVLQDSDDNSSFGTLATITAGEFQNVTLRKQYIKVSTSATLYMLGN